MVQVAGNAPTHGTNLVRLPIIIRTMLFTLYLGKWRNPEITLLTPFGAIRLAIDASASASLGSIKNVGGDGKTRIYTSFRTPTFEVGTATLRHIPVRPARLALARYYYFARLFKSLVSSFHQGREIGPSDRSSTRNAFRRSALNGMCIVFHHTGIKAW